MRTDDIPQYFVKWYAERSETTHEDALQELTRIREVAPRKYEKLWDDRIKEEKGEY